MKQVHLGWLAGVLDSEGAIGITRTGETMTAVVQMETTCADTAERVVDLVGSIGASVRTYSYRARNPKHKPSYTMRLARLLDVQLLAEAMIPVAVTKKGQWEIVYEFTTSRLKERHIDVSGKVTRGGARRFPYSEREVELWHLIKALNRKGPRTGR